MFDQIHFEEVQNTVAFNENNLISRFTRHDHPAPDSPLASSNPVMSQIRPDNASFSVSGTIRYLPVHPVSPHAEEYYLHVLSFGIMDVGKDFFTRRKAAESFLLLYTYQGGGILEYEGKRYHLTEGDGFFIDCRNYHYYHADAEHWYYSALHFDGPGVRDLYDTYRTCGGSVFHSPLNGDYQYRLEQLIRIYDTIPANMELRLSRELYLLVTDLILSRESEKADTVTLTENIRNLIRRMEQDFTHPWTLDELAACAAVSKYHFSREFRRCTGISPLAYLSRIRMENARYLLKNTDLPIGQIGCLVGLDNPNTFDYQFRNYTGMTPREFRKM